VAWATVGRVVARVAADAEQAADRFDGLRRIGIDEIACAPRGAVIPGGVGDPTTGRRNGRTKLRTADPWRCRGRREQS